MFMFHAAWPASHQPAFRPTRGSGDGAAADTIGVTGLGIDDGGVGGVGGGVPRPPRPGPGAAPSAAGCPAAGAAAGVPAGCAAAGCDGAGDDGEAAAGCDGCAGAVAAGCAGAAAGGVFVALPHAVMIIASVPAASVPVIRDISEVLPIRGVCPPATACPSQPGG